MTSIAPNWPENSAETGNIPLIKVHKQAILFIFWGGVGIVRRLKTDGAAPRVRSEMEFAIPRDEGKVLLCWRRSENKIKNHFYARLRKSIREVNKFIETTLCSEYTILNK